MKALLLLVAIFATCAASGALISRSAAKDLAVDLAAARAVAMQEAAIALGTPGAAVAAADFSRVLVACTNLQLRERSYRSAWGVSKQDAGALAALCPLALRGALRRFVAVGDCERARAALVVYTSPVDELGARAVIKCGGVR